MASTSLVSCRPTHFVRGLWLHRSSPVVARLARASLLFTLSASVAACALMEAPTSPTPSRRFASPPSLPSIPVASDEVPTPRPVPSSGIDLIGAADALADLESYRVAIVSRGLVPSSATDGRVTMTSTLVQGDVPAAAFTMTGVDGVEGLADAPLRVIVIGDEAWLRSGTGRWTKSPGGAADFDAAITTLSPTELVSGFEALGRAFVKVGPEAKNGWPTTRYHVESTNPIAVEGGLTAGGIDVWLGRDAGELIGILADGTVDVDGTVTSVYLRIDVTHVNDPTNRVRPPV
jgi:hypothetical protein